MRKSQRPADSLSFAPPPPNVTSPESEPCASALYCDDALVLTIAPFPSGPDPSTTTVRFATRTVSAASPPPETSSAPRSFTTIRPSAPAKGVATLNRSAPSRTTTSPEWLGFGCATTSAPSPAFSNVAAPLRTGAVAAAAFETDSVPPFRMNDEKPENPPLSSSRPPPFLAKTPEAPDTATSTFAVEAGLATDTLNGVAPAASVPAPEMKRLPPVSPTPRTSSVNVCPEARANSESPA